jgi:hypothetical protein
MLQNKSIFGKQLIKPSQPYPRKIKLSILPSMTGSAIESYFPNK